MKYLKTYENLEAYKYFIWDATKEEENGIQPHYEIYEIIKMNDKFTEFRHMYSYPPLKKIKEQSAQGSVARIDGNLFKLDFAQNFLLYKSNNLRETIAMVRLLNDTNKYNL